MSELQLAINLDHSPNTLRSSLKNGDFLFLAECSVPTEERDIGKAAERLMPLAEKMWSFDDLHGGLAVTDRPGAPWSAAELASALPEQQRNRNLFYVSGANRDDETHTRELTLAAAANIQNLVAVTGEAYPLLPCECRNRKFTGSLPALKKMNEAACFYPGAVFNPFQYRVYPALAACRQLKRKLTGGANFIVLQAGWDMLQLQTVSWYLLKQQLYYPLIARLILLTPDKMEKIVAGEVPGVRISRDFRKLLERELCGSRAQFEAAQYRRLEIQVAGCRLMGFSGVQICGLDFPGRAAIVADRIRSALKEFRNFDQWLLEYNAHQAEGELNFDSRNFHLYDRVLRRPYPFGEPPVGSDPGAPQMTGSEKFAYQLRKTLFSRADRRRAGSDRLLKKLLAGCRSCDNCRLPQHEYVCPETCPKHLDAGPCGGVKIDGSCEIGDFECRHVRIARYSYWRKRGGDLES